ncbi:MAG: HDIG domain-containing protein [Puniceicoccales bacterium]|jgi:putative nucleotidyltransferase with HDIG domain|nr:HDIG domain-containing protein [Puniceicoccales bacterium]
MVAKRWQGGIFGMSSRTEATQIESRYPVWQRKIGGILTFLLFSFGFALVSFFGNNCLRIQFIPGNVSKSRIVADLAFEYESKIKTEKLYEQKRHQADNVFYIDKKCYDDFIEVLKLLDEQIENFTYEHTLSEAGRNDIREFINEFVASNVIKLEWHDIAILISSLTPIERTQAFQECISLLREIARDGVFSEEVSASLRQFSMSYTGIKLKSDKRRNLRTLEQALHYIRMHLRSMDVDQDVANIFFNIIKQGIKPNLVFDAEESKARLEMIRKSIKPVRVKVRQGDLILDGDTVINDEIHEALVAYQKVLKQSNYIGCGFYRDFYTKILQGMVALYVAMVLLQVLQKNKTFNLKTLVGCGILTMAQLLFLRIFLQIGNHEVFLKHFTLLNCFPLCLPLLWASGITILLYGFSGGVIVAFFVSLYYTLMISKSIHFFLMLLTSHFIFLAFLKNINFRIKIIWAGILSGTIIAALMLAEHLFPMTINRLVLFQSGILMIMCIGSGLLTVILFPIFERLFSVYSNVTLFELMDYNNQILKNLQITAPGTYNHSLIVSNIAEQVAISANANSVLCKTGALFHDIGKMLKAAYFIENQNNQINLHDQQTPYLSTLIVKNHVKDGVALAKQYRLPSPIIDIIQQHHGTTLIYYFYEKAKHDLLLSIDTENMSDEEINMFITNKLDASVFRYNGPRPRTKENLIVMLSDSIEAASRTLKRITYQTIENLVNMIFDIKLNDHQLDECPITFDEIRELRKIFASIILSMMHSRISYNLLEDGTGMDNMGSNIYWRSE